jgi:hypothetical protein
MDIINRAKNIIMTPKTEWSVIAAEEPNASGIITGYALPLILVAAIAAFIGYGFIGYNIGVLGSSVRIAGVNWGLYHAIIIILTGFLSVYLGAFVVDALAPSFGSEKNFGRAVQLVVYSYTPAWIGGILMIYPALGWIGGLFGIYGLYLLYLGLPHTMKTPQDKVAIYLIVTIVALILVYVIVGLIFTGILTSAFGLDTPGVNHIVY